MAQSQRLNTEEPIPWLDRCDPATLLAGSLVVLITFFTSYSHVDIPGHVSIAVHLQIRMPLLLAAQAALVGVDEVFSVGLVQLASSNRCAAQWIESRLDAERLKSKTALHKIDNARLAAFESKLDLLLLSADSSSPVPPATDGN